MSDFLKVISEFRNSSGLMFEDARVRNREQSALPDKDVDDIDYPTSDNEPEVPSDLDMDKPDPDVEQNFTDREILLLNALLELYRNNANYSIETKNELSELYKNGQYEDLWNRFISIVDGFAL